MSSLFTRIASVDRWQWWAARAEGFAWERYFCVETKTTPALVRAPRPEETIGYEPLAWQLVRSGLEMLGLGSADVFVDYGAGLGRSLLMAARLRLKQVLGVEFLPALAERARRNVAAAQHRLKSPVEVVVADARSWIVPADVSAAYLFNPFVGSVMKAAQELLRRSLEQTPRRFRLLYVHPRDQPDLFEPCAWLARRESRSAGVFGGTLSLYEAR